MNWNTILFGIFPYIALTLAVVVTAYRMVYRPFSVSAQSSQLLEQKRLFYGSIAMHWGLVLVLLGHLLALLIPKGLLLWNAVPLRLYLLEITGLGLGLWALVGTWVLLTRRLSVARVRAASTSMDYVVLVVIFVSVLSGVLTALFYRYGSYWFPAVMTPYLWSILAIPLLPVGAHHHRSPGLRAKALADRHLGAQAGEVNQWSTILFSWKRNALTASGCFGSPPSALP